MTDTPQSDRQEQVIAEMVALFQRHGSRVHPRQHIGALYEAGWFIAESDLSYLVRDGLCLVGGEAPEERRAGEQAVATEPLARAGRYAGEPDSAATSPAAPAVDEELKRLINVLTGAARRARAGTGVAQERVVDAEQAIRSYVAKRREGA